MVYERFQLTANPKVEILAVDGADFLRYDGIATVVKNDVVLNKIREASPQIMDKYDKNGWEMGDADSLLSHGRLSPF